MILGATPAAAAMDSCPQGTDALFTGTTTYLGQEGETNIWSTHVTLYAYCGTVDAAHALTNVAVSGVYANSNGIIPDLEASADGSDPSVVLVIQHPHTPLTFSPLPTAPGLFTDSTGKVEFTLRAQSPSHPFLAGVDGAPRVIGMQLDMGTGTATDPTGDPLPYDVGGLGSIVASTPELDSLALFGTGAMGLAGYAVLRLRARRPR